MNGNQETTQNSTYKKGVWSEINDTKEILEGTFPINLKLIKEHQWKHPSLIAKYKEVMYHTGSYFGLSNIDINLITSEDKSFIPSILKN